MRHLRDYKHKQTHREVNCDNELQSTQAGRPRFANSRTETTENSKYIPFVGKWNENIIKL